jgi:hypothetical protein
VWIEKSLTGSSHTERMVNAKSRHLSGYWHWLTKLETFSRTRTGLRVDLFDVLPAEKGLEGNTKDNRNGLKLVNSWETGLPLDSTSRISTITP